MAKRKRKQRTNLTRNKPKIYYPFMQCTKEDIVIAVSHTQCKSKVKVHWIHFDNEKGVGCEFRKGYEFSLKGNKKGETVYCPHCDGVLDFRMWMSDTLPKLTYDKKGNDDVKLLQEKEK